MGESPDRAIESRGNLDVEDILRGQGGHARAGGYWDNHVMGDPLDCMRTDSLHMDKTVLSSQARNCPCSTCLAPCWRHVDDQRDPDRTPQAEDRHRQSE